MMKDHKDVKIIRNYSTIFKELREFCKKHDITFIRPCFLGVWIEGEYLMQSYGDIYHSKFENFNK